MLPYSEKTPQLKGKHSITGKGMQEDNSRYQNQKIVSDKR